jgi:hypothetical protein
MKKANQSMSKTFDIKLGEAIDEHLDLSVCDLSNFTDVTMDLSKVKMINSVGVKTLLSFFKNHADKHVILRNCTVPFIQQYNIFPGTLRKFPLNHSRFPIFVMNVILRKNFLS